MNDFSVHNDLFPKGHDNEELRREEDTILWERGLDPSELKEDERRDLVDDLRGEQLAEDDNDLSDVVPPEEADGND